MDLVNRLYDIIQENDYELSMYPDLKKELERELKSEEGKLLIIKMLCGMIDGEEE